jgi:hypothetical protein
MIFGREHSPLWRVSRNTQLGRKDGKTGKLKLAHATSRMITSFEYVGDPLPAPDAQELLSA